jgi:hypothetical protein
MKSLKWALFLSFVLFYSVPRFVYAIKVLLPKEPENEDPCKMCNCIANDVKELNLQYK